ncbi:MAG: cyclic nucleotide-binding/CBS domain-containing protein [Promethearchaeota archaeon]
MTLEELDEVKDVTVDEVMATEVVKLPPKHPVTVAAKYMKEKHIGAIIVQEEGKPPFGIITKGDIIYRVVAFGYDPGLVTLEAIASSPIVSISPSTTCEQAMLIMAKNKIERLVVTDEEGKPIGVVSVNDILRVAPGLLRIRREYWLQEQYSFQEDSPDSGYCEDCGEFSTDLSNIGGILLCPICLENREEEFEEDEEYL